MMVVLLPCVCYSANCNFYLRRLVYTEDAADAFISCWAVCVCVCACARTMCVCVCVCVCVRDILSFCCGAAAVRAELTEVDLSILYQVRELPAVVHIHTHADCDLTQFAYFGIPVVDTHFIGSHWQANAAAVPTPCAPLILLFFSLPAAVQQLIFWWGRASLRRSRYVGWTAVGPVQTVQIFLDVRSFKSGELAKRWRWSVLAAAACRGNIFGSRHLEGGASVASASTTVGCYRGSRWHAHWVGAVTCSCYWCSQFGYRQNLCALNSTVLSARNLADAVLILMNSSLRVLLFRFYK
jgi:hypothetical protein